LGVIAGNFKDARYKVGRDSITSAGVYKDGQWLSLGLGRYGNTTSTLEAGSYANAITADGWVFGMSYEKSNVSIIVPMVWKPDEITGQYTDTVVYSFPEDNLPVAARNQGSRFTDVSTDGSIACGWGTYAATHGGRRAIVWRSATDYKILNPNYSGEANDVSPNGKYVAVTTNGRAALYNVEKDSLIIFGVLGTSASAVSNDGLVLGFRDLASEGRKGFLWSDKLGYIELKEFFENYAPEIILPEYYQFTNDDNDFMLDVPSTISGDGLVLSGYRGAGIVRRIWVVALPAPLDLVSRPSGVTASVDPAKRNEVEVTWSAPEAEAGHRLDFYYIYRNGTYIGRVESFEETTFTDTEVPAGLITYTVSAVYDFNGITNTYRESTRSESATISIIDTYELPFYDGFEDNYATNHWSVTPDDLSNGWAIHSEGYWETPGRSAVFVAAGDGTNYVHTLTTKPLDATTQTKVTASFIYRINTYSTPFSVRDTIYFEVSSDIYGTEWNVVKSYLLKESLPWTTQTLDVTDLVKGKFFKARFRAVSGSNLTTIIFTVDEFAIAVAPVAVSPVVAATKKTDKVEVRWQDPSGSYGLTYAKASRNYLIGDEGVPFIAVNKFSKNDLHPYKQLKLTSISAYINSNAINATVDTKIKLAVFVDNVRVTDQEITSFEARAWNTFLLDTPVELSGVNSELAFGIDVVEHDTATLVLATDNLPTVTGKGDAFTEDGGATWHSLAEYGYFSGWCIIGNVRETAAETERTPKILGYEIYRGNEKINTGLSFSQTFVDTATALDSPCYTVKAFYSVGGLSDFSTAGCAQPDDSGLKNLSVSEFSVYPNPTAGKVFIKNETGKAPEVVIVSNPAGKQLLHTTGNVVDFSAFVNGVYLLQIDGTIFKIIKK
jgi:hypothetical protein